MLASQVKASPCASPSTVGLADTDLPATRWPAQDDVDWIATTRCDAGPSASYLLLPTSPPQFVPY